MNSKLSITLAGLLVAGLLAAAAGLATGSGAGAASAEPQADTFRLLRGAPHRIQSPRLEAEFVDGHLTQLTDLASGGKLMQPGGDSRSQPFTPFGDLHPVDLRNASTTVNLVGKRLFARYLWPDGTRIDKEWRLEDGGDLVLRASAQTPHPVDMFAIDLPACDLTSRQMVRVTNFGVGRVLTAPATGPIVQDAEPGSPWRMRYVQPLLVLFEGQGSGFVIEGRDARTGPSIVGIHGNGDNVDIAMVRYTGEPSQRHHMYEIRMRAYSGSWHAAVDPYVDWMEKGLGFVPLEKQSPAWVRDVRGQFYNDPHPDVQAAWDMLDAMADRVVPSRTLLGKISEYRLPRWGFDHGWGDYSFDDDKKAFFLHARRLGFNIAAHINVSGVDLDLPELIEKFRPGLQEIGRDAQGQPIYMGYTGTEPPRPFSNVYGPVRFAWCSPAYKPFRDHLLAEIKPLVDAGVNAIYFDEGHSPFGKFVVDGMTAIEGVMQLQRDVRAAYPHVAIMTEQFNPMSSKYAAFGLQTIDQGHPLSGYLYRRFIRVAAWHGYETQDVDRLEAYWRWGGPRLVGAGNSEPWLEIANAFNKYELDPAYELPLAPHQLSAYEGANGVRAYYEKHQEKMGLVIYGDGPEPKWFGVRTIVAPDDVTESME